MIRGSNPLTPVIQLPASGFSSFLPEASDLYFLYFAFPMAGLKKIPSFQRGKKEATLHFTPSFFFSFLCFCFRKVFCAMETKKKTRRLRETIFGQSKKIRK
jgi:hypothetical protein